MSNLPDRPPGSQPPTPARHLSTQQFEAVIRRAAELQARAADEPGGEMSEAETMRIGGELGLSPAHLTRALAEVRGQGAREQGVLYRLFGEATVHAARLVAGNAESVRGQLEAFLLSREYFRVKRRFPGRVVYEPASGVVAAIGRAASQVSGRTTPLKLPLLEVAVDPVGAEQALVTLSSSLAGQRAGVAAGAAAAGVGGGGVAAAVLAIAIAPPAALVGLPVLAGSYFGMRALYSGMAGRAREQLESLLDRLEHGEIAAAVGPRPRSVR